MEAIGHFLSHHWFEIVVGFVFAAIFGIIADLIRIGSMIRSGLRHLKNKLSEVSVARLEGRIGQLEEQRDLYAAYMTSDKALYLTALNYVLSVLSLMCIGIIMLTVDHIMPLLEPFVRLWLRFTSLMMFVLSVTVALKGARISSWYTQSKIQKVVGRLQEEIDELKVKLASRRQ